MLSSIVSRITITSMLVLGIETSCDETGIALYDQQDGLVAHCLHSQALMHEEYGGVVPELAARDHIRIALPLVEQALNTAQRTKSSLNGVAYTAGPGLVGALMVGACLGKAIAMALGIPAISVHHLEAHLMAPLLDNPNITPPFIALLVSGGHTQLIAVHAWGRYEILGDTRDDAAGEVFDKVAQMLDIGYPGGPAIARYAAQSTKSTLTLPEPMTQVAGLDFSFSGLKTQAMYLIEQHRKSNGTLPSQSIIDIATAFEIAITNTLTIKCRRALSATQYRTLLVSGGVGANLRLRTQLNQLIGTVNGGKIYYPRIEFCTDNGAMVAYTGYRRLSAGQCDDIPVVISPRWPLTDLPPL